MKILHTADWHLGRNLHGVSLLGDQAYVLDQLVGIVRQECPDCVLIAGDIFDRAIPPVDAVQLLDDTLARLVLELNAPVLMIAGNHDSPERMQFNSALLRKQNLFVAGTVQPHPKPVMISNQHGTLRVHLVPYGEPAVFREKLGNQAIQDHDQAMACAVAQITPALDKTCHNILLAHAFVDGGKSSDTERPLWVGGAGTVLPGHFAGFDYTALGHLHRTQAMGAEHIRYAGSILKYGFAEASDQKDNMGCCWWIYPVREKPKHERLLLIPAVICTSWKGVLTNCCAKRQTNHTETITYASIYSTKPWSMMPCIGCNKLFPISCIWSARRCIIHWIPNRPVLTGAKSTRSSYLRAFTGKSPGRS